MQAQSMTTRWQEAGIVMHTAYWPLVIETMPSIFPDNDVVVRWLSRREQVAARGLKFVTLLDTLATLKAAPAQQRQTLSEWFKTNRAFNAHCVGVVILINSAIVRGALTALTWITPPPQPWIAEGSWPAGLARAQALLTQNGIQCSPAMRDFIESGGWRDRLSG